MEKILEYRDHICTGCAACKNICPVSAIQLDIHNNGYYLPEIDRSLCIKCGMCEIVCPVLNKQRLELPQCHAVWADDNTRLQSSSGGAFSVLARSILKDNGIVFGAAWSDDFFIRHIYIETEDELDRLCRSKYAQSEIKDSFRQVKAFLAEGRKVMFVGTPCQTAGLEAYLEGTNREGLLMVDFICYYNPPISYVRRYLDEKYGLENLTEFSFRDKSYGWISSATRAVLKDGKVITDKTGGCYMQGFYEGLYVREACTKCTFSGGNHCSDITMGDFWKIEDHDVSWNDGRGTSMVILRTGKAINYFNKIKANLRRSQLVPMEWIREGQSNCKRVHPAKAYFDDLLTFKSFRESVDMALNNRYDIGMVCVQSYQNYGSAFTNYALYKVLKDLKYSVLIITQPLSSEIKPLDYDNFMNTPFQKFEIAKHYHKRQDMGELNRQCSIFLVGSDQLFNYEIYRKIDSFIKLDWVDDQHKKLSYATSFGQDRILGTLEESVDFKKCLSRFSNISVRENSGVKLFQENFCLIAEQVLDPVFLCNIEHYRELCKDLKPYDRKIFAYILDPNIEKEKALNYFSTEIGLEIVALVDRWMDAQYVSEHWNIPTMTAQKNEVWLRLIMDSEFVFTDSFHGMCFSIIFEKQFVVINNKNRGTARFKELLETLNLTDFIYDTPADFIAQWTPTKRINYQKVKRILENEKTKSLNWLMNALDEDGKSI